MKTIVYYVSLLFTMLPFRRIRVWFKCFNNELALPWNSTYSAFKATRNNFWKWEWLYGLVALEEKLAHRLQWIKVDGHWRPTKTPEKFSFKCLLWNHSPVVSKQPEGDSWIACERCNKFFETFTSRTAMINAWLGSQPVKNETVK